MDMGTRKKREVPQVWREKFAAFAVTENELPRPR
jgi:hypothetical protein